jgi:wobble nucleotide-excising tRNase
MITKINKLKDFGIFHNFSWDGTLTPFRKKDLIYGWNYSGKTTLSKLFSNLEKKSKLHFTQAEYILEIERNSETFTQDQLADFPYFVKVFNSNYIKFVFSWDKENNEGFEPILFYLGDEAGDIQPKIDNLKDRWNPKIDEIKKRFEAVVTSFDEYTKESGKFSKQATEIRKYLNDQIKASEFNKGHFIDIVAEIKSDIATHTLNGDIINETKQKAIALNEYFEQNEIYELAENINTIGSKVKSLLEDTAPKSVPFPELDEDGNLFKWVQTGVGLHNQATKCKFCGNDLKEERITALNQYYSDKLKVIQKAIKDIRAEIENDKLGLNFEFPHESKIAKHLQVRYIEAVKAYNSQKAVYINELSIFEKDIKIKESSYFTSVGSTQFAVKSVNTELQTVIDVIKLHNSFVSTFVETKAEALKLILKHYVAEYLTSENYLTKEADSKSASQIITRCKAKTLENNQQISIFEALLKNTVKGQEELNIYLKIFLNREDIQIDIANDKFVLKRGTQPASNLSEGEKTAIAFAYFLTELKSLKKENKLKDTIIFIDDPISSLDSNHIFQVRSLIQYFFANEADYMQLFISTHNFEFFSVMLDSTLFNNNTNSQDKAKPLYIISRNKENQSSLKNLPKTLRSHKSEYVHIFHILKEYNELANKEEFPYTVLLPNTLRRFLELYTLLKYPKGYCEVDERLKEVFSPEDGAYHNTKLYHWFSHQNQFEKVAQHDSKLILIDDAISEVIEHIKNKDKLHWKGLTGEELY